MHYECCIVDQLHSIYLFPRLSPACNNPVTRLTQPCDNLGDRLVKLTVFLQHNLDWGHNSWSFTDLLLLQHMLQELLIHRPKDPLQFLIDQSSHPSHDGKALNSSFCIILNCMHQVPKIVIYGPPCSGQYSIVRPVSNFTSKHDDFICPQSKAVARKLRAVHIRPKHIVEEARATDAEITNETLEVTNY